MSITVIDLRRSSRIHQHFQRERQVNKSASGAGALVPSSPISALAWKSSTNAGTPRCPWCCEGFRTLLGGEKACYRQCVPLNICPSALNVYPCISLHCLNNPGLFFSCSNADATTSALGMSGSVAIEKHVDLRGCEISRTNL